MENKIRELIDKLNYYTKLYDEGHPEISDYEWDCMYFDLVAAEGVTGRYYEDSPTQKISYTVVNELGKVKHNHPMLSLDKTKSIDTVSSFIDGKKYITMAKMDGLTCTLEYEKGKLVAAETRGDGVVGENVLHNALVIKNIPKKINYLQHLIVDGEVVCDYQNFERFKDDYKNPRNFASGSIRLLNNEESAKRGLSFVAWDVIEGLADNDYLSTRLIELQKIGFQTVPFYCNRGIEESIDTIKEDCKTLGYPIDGIVFKYDKVEEYLAQGRTDHHYKGGIAFKFYDELIETTLRDITWTMGRTGQLTPVAIYDEIDIDGSLCNKASLHNINTMRETLGQAYVGQKIYVFKANSIIPQLAPSIDKDREGTGYNDFIIPEVCPVCGKPTSIHKDNNSEILYCDNPACSGKIINRFEHFMGKKGLDIKGISKATIEKLLNWGWLNTYQDIFLLYQYKDQWIKKPGFGTASVDKILQAIEDSKKTSLEKIIAAAGVPEIGAKVARDLASHYESWADFRKETDYSQYDGIGVVMNDNLLSFDYEDMNLDYVANHFLNTINKKEHEDKTIENLKNKVFCITGKVNSFKNRNELQADIERKGGKVVGAVSKNINYLINNDVTSTSAKNKKAQELGVKIITEEQYLNLDF